MKYALVDCGDHWKVRDENTGYIAGLLVHQFAVYDDNNDRVALINSIEAAIPQLELHYLKHPPRWRRRNPTLYTKLTRFGRLRIEQEQSGRWVAFRNDYPLYRDDARATFPSLVAAKRIADSYINDGFPGSVTDADNFAWATSIFQ
jgi:hypothetical protein